MVKHTFLELRIWAVLLFFLITAPLYAERPIIGVLEFNTSSLRVKGFATIIESHINSVINTSGVLSLINPTLLKEQLTKFGCLEEDCLLKFARTAKINLLIRGYIKDVGNSIIITLYSLGIDAPYFGGIVNEYVAKIPLTGLSLSSREYNFISEEHAGYFLAKLLKKYKSQVFVKKDNNNKIIFNSDEMISGQFLLYRYKKIPQSQDNIRLYRGVCSISIDNNNVIDATLDTSAIKENDFFFYTYSKKAAFLEEYYYGRKMEMIFREYRGRDAMVMLFTTVPVSLLMPIISPVSYYRINDFQGLALWALNAAPYFYLEYSGLTHRPNTYKEGTNKKDISRKVKTRYRFGLYMLLLGGMPLSIDAFSNRLLYFSSAYKPNQPYMGNTISAIYLSTLFGGGGHFYKGYRLQGYLYFHLHNFLLYSALKEFSPGEKYNIENNSYVREKIDKKKAYAYMSALGLLKIIELTHVALINFNIKSGTIIEDNYSFAPDLSISKDGSLNIGAKYTYRF